MLLKGPGDLPKLGKLHSNVTTHLRNNSSHHFTAEAWTCWAQTWEPGSAPLQPQQLRTKTVPYRLDIQCFQMKSSMEWWPRNQPWRVFKVHMAEESQAGSSHGALFFYCTIIALHARHCPLLEVLVSRIKFRAPHCIQRGVRELFLCMGHQAMLSLHTTVGPQPGEVKICNRKIKWQGKQKLGPCQIWYLEK